MMTTETQTELSSAQLLSRERQLEVREGELEVVRFRARQDTDNRERALFRRERELEIRERVAEERAQEYLFKQKELN